MKKISSFIFIFFLNSNILSQVSTEDLDNPLFGVRLIALEIIIKENLADYIPEIQMRLFDQTTLTMQFSFLDALSKLKDSEIENWTFQFIDNSDNFQYPEDPLYYKVQATEILFSINNYSTVQYVFDLLHRDTNFADPVCLTLLKEIILYIPSHRLEANEELVRILNNKNIDNNLRYFALKILNETKYSDILNLSINAVFEDTYAEIRFYANGILNENNFSGLHELYVQQLSIDPEAYIRSTYATSLLLLFGGPSDLQLVMNYQPSDPDELSRNFVAVAIEEFIPPNPDTLNWYGLTTKLIDYADEMYGYGWIAEEETRKHYSKMLTDIIESIENTGQTVAACSIIQSQILERLEEDLGMELVTVEGYKFLHYYTIYIKEELEEQYGTCP